VQCRRFVKPHARWREAETKTIAARLGGAID
jgi:hypothetical protein